MWHLLPCSWTFEPNLGNTSSLSHTWRKAASVVFFSFFFFLMGLGLNAELCIYKAGALILEPHPSPFHCGYFGDGGLSKLFCPGWC
jgi:hypothetical protein